MDSNKIASELVKLAKDLVAEKITKEEITNANKIADIFNKSDSIVGVDVKTDKKSIIWTAILKKER